jgi:hypothetical protein
MIQPREDNGASSNNNIQKAQARLQFSDSILQIFSKPIQHKSENINWKLISARLLESTQFRI